jgi:hypothetical protein
VVSVALAATAGLALAADEPKLAGNWKMVLLPFGEDDFYIISVKGKAPDYTVSLVDSQERLGPIEPTSFSAEGSKVQLLLDAGEQKVEFNGALATEGDNKGRILGIVIFRGSPYPARLEPTKDKKVVPFGEKENPLLKPLQEAASNEDPKARVEALAKLLADSAAPQLHQAYSVLLGSAEDAGLTEEEVRAHLTEWFAEAKPYGPIWEADCRMKALQGLTGKKTFAALGLELAKELESGLPEDAPLDRQVAILQTLASAARLADETELADETDSRLAKLEEKLDADYLAKVPPFKPEPFAGRKNPEHNRVVLMELFTGAQCPPCVAADVAFDALLKAYKPTEFIGLQYHVHIPGPDPLTNPDSLERLGYYEAGGTPSTYFNGAEGAGGGGGMGNARAKFGEYIELINTELEGTRRAEIELAVTRSGTKALVKIAARVAEGGGEGDDSDAEGDEAESDDGEDASENNDDANEEDANGDDAEDGEDKEDEDAGEGEGDDEDGDDAQTAAGGEGTLRLRVVLTEESIRYVGGNRLRFHHHVVRAFPGGVQGKELVGGQCETELTIDLEEVRKAQEEYVETYTKEQGGFPNTPPAVGLEHISVVAFVQDDSDKSILYAVTAEIPKE